MIEYHTVHIPTPMPPKPLSSTYREKLIARFGRVPSMAELAKLESATSRMDARRSRTKETIGQLVAALTRPMTNQDLATATGIPLSTVANLMLRALDEGAVKRERIQRVYIWKRADSPDKPPALPPIRGVVYATIAAAAKALDVDAATVRRAFKRGTQDNTGLGRQPGFKGTPRWAKTP